MMERHLKKGTIFISLEDEEVYQVSGIISSWEEMFFGAPMPLMLEATFMPFRDVIISDGLVMPYNILNVQGCIYDCKKERPDPPVALRKRFE